MSRFGLGEGVMGFGGDDREFQQVAARVENRMRDIGGGIDFAINMSLLSRISSGLGNMGKAAEEMAVKVRLGEAAFGDLFEKVAEKIPIFGNFILAGRAIHELITGEQAYTEVLKAQNEEQVKRVDLFDKLIAGVRGLTNQRDTSAAKSGATADRNPFVVNAQDVLRKGEAEAAKIIQGIRDQNRKLLDEVEKQKEELQAKITTEQESEASFQNRGADNPKPMTEFSNNVTRELEAKFKAVEKRSNELRAAMGAAEEAATLVVGRGVFTQLGKMIGGEIEKGVDKAVGAIKRYVSRLEPMGAITESALTRAGGAWGKYQTQLSAFSQDLQRGNLTQADFEKLAGASFWDNASKSLGDYFNEFRARAETIGRIIDSNLGSPVNKIGQAIGGMLGAFDFGGKRPNLPNVAAPTPFRASFVGLEQLGRNIQEAAGSGSDRTLDGIKTAAERTAASTAEAARILKNLKGPIG